MTHLRRAFEIWFGGSYTGVNFEYGKAGYTNATTQLAWQSYCAGRAFIPPVRVNP